MKIIQVIGSLTGRGAERVCLSLHHGFLKAGHESKIVITHQNIDYEVDEYVEYIPASQLLDYIESTQYDLLLGHMLHSLKLLRKIKGKKNVCFVLHTTLSEKVKKKPWKQRIKSTLIKKILYRGANVICVSKWVENDLLNNMKIRPAFVTTIYNPFDFEQIQKLSLERYESLDYAYIIAVGSLSEVKRYDLLLRAYALLDTDLHLVLLGKGEKEESLRALSQTLGIADKVHFLGWKPNPYGYIKDAELFVLSSDIEGLPSVVIESLALDTPVVSTDCPSGIREIMDGELTAYLSKTGDAQDLAAKISMALQYYPTIDKKQLEKFSVQKVLQEYLHLSNRDQFEKNDAKI